MLDGNTAALRAEDLRRDRQDAEQAALEARAEPDFLHMMRNLDSDLIDAALGQLTRDDYRHLIEDLADGPTRDFSHAGLIVLDAVKRYVWEVAIKGY